MERTAESSALPVTEVSMEQLHVQMNNELQDTCFFRIKHDGRCEKVAVVNRYAPNAEYNPEDIAYVPMAPICKRQRWWPIAGTQHYGMTDDARLTISDLNRLPHPIMLTHHELTHADIKEIISGLQQMRIL